MPSSPLAVGLVGYGYAGKTFHAPLISSCADLQLTTVVSRDAQKVQQDYPHVNVVDQIQTLLADPAISVVVIATPNDSHFPLAQMALAAGKHVVVDKPFTITVEQAKQLQQLADQNKLLLSVFHNRRWDGDFISIKEIIRRHQLGHVAYFASHFDRFRPQVRDRWREKAGDGTGLWFDLGPHLLDQTLQLFGLPDSIFVDLAQLRNHAQTDDYFHAILSYPQRRVILHASCLVAANTPRFELHGEKGSYIKYGLDNQEDRLKAGVTPDNKQWGYPLATGQLTLTQGDTVDQPQPLTNEPGNYPAYYQAIANAINHQAVNPVTAQEAIMVMQLLAQGYQSAIQQQVLTIPPV